MDGGDLRELLVLSNKYLSLRNPGVGENMKRSARGPSAEVIRKNLLSPTIKRAALTDIVLGNQSPWICNNRASLST